MHRLTRNGTWARLVRTAAILLTGAATPCPGSDGETITVGRLEKQGIAVEAALRPLRGDGIAAGDTVGFELSIQDTTTGAALTGAYPALWMHPRTEPRATGSHDCFDRIQSFIGGSLFSEAELDLNVFYVLTLNDDATISVVDPRFGFGRPRPVRQLPLPGPGFDWDLTRDQGLLFVTVPDRGELVRFETADWRGERLLLGGKPMHLALQPDQHYLWAGLEDGVAVLESETLKQVARIRTGGRPESIAFSADSRHAYLADREAGTVSIIEVATLSLIAELETGPEPVSMDYSALAAALYVAHAGDGSIASIDGNSHRIVARTQSEPGLGSLRFAPDQRWALITNPVTDRLSILDAANNRIVQSGLVERGPDQIAFSNELAYIRHRGSSTLLMLTLDDEDIGRPGVAIPVVDTPGGDKPPGIMDLPTPAPGIVKAPGASAVIIANPGDGAIYFYKEGMAAPMGQFLTPGRAPRAVLALDRSLKERRTPGLYQTSARLPEAGDYDLVLFLDSPRFLHCFALTLGGPPEPPSEPSLRLAPVERDGPLKAGRPARLRFRFEASTSSPSPPISAGRIYALVSMGTGQWSKRRPLRPSPDGLLELEFIPPLPGDYLVHLQADGLDLSPRQLRPHVVHVY